MTTIDDHYKDTPLLRRWRIVDGFPRCVDDAIPHDHPTAESVLAANAEVRAQIAAVEAYEAALRLTAGDPPAETLVSADLNGDPVETPNPAFAAYADALALIAVATSETLALAALRSPVEVEAE
jgi:hypothetical protein